MKTMKLHPIHPFPARMAPSIVMKELLNTERPMRVLDPMAGSGTTIVTAKALGHNAIGFDTDPLAVLIARGWSTKVDKQKLATTAKVVLDRARRRYRRLPLSKAYPRGADEETRTFVRMWFDNTNRRQLAALAQSISRVRDSDVRTLLWCAFSRLIITKVGGVSLAMDTSHSRPHKVYDKAPITALKHFQRAVATILNAAPFTTGQRAPRTRVNRSDARWMPLKKRTVDIVITSPPYLNAIDYLRGHKFSLIWMGYQLRELRELRANNVGSEISLDIQRNSSVREILYKMGDIRRLPKREQGMLANYILNMELVLAEISRVLKKSGRAVLVIGDSTIRGVFVRNSTAIKCLAKRNGLEVRSVRRRPLEDRRRYLPPPTSHRSGERLQSRMREEVIITFRRPA